MMMRRAFQVCFAEPAVTAIVFDPLTSNTRAHKFYRRLEVGAILLAAYL